MGRPRKSIEKVKQELFNVYSNDVILVDETYCHQKIHESSGDIESIVDCFLFRHIEHVARMHPPLNGSFVNAINEKQTFSRDKFYKLLREMSERGFSTHISCSTILFSPLNRADE